MKLYVSPGTCSLAAHVVVRELALPVSIACVRLHDPLAAHHKINPSGRVPALELDDGSGLTENTAILPFLADLQPGNTLFAPAGSVERARIQSWLGYFSSEVHAACFRAINRPGRYHPDAGQHAAIQASALGLLSGALTPVSEHLKDRRWLVGERFTLADAYLGVFAGWITRIPGQPYADTPLAGFMERYNALPSVVAAKEFEARFNATATTA